MDPAIIFHLAANSQMPLEQIDEELQHNSGLLGISGLSNDMRDILRASEDGQERPRLALEIFVHRLKKYIGAYMAVLGKVDGLVFTGGIGENSGVVRQKAVENMERFGLRLDSRANKSVPQGQASEISTADSDVKIMVIPTNEEVLIARQTLALAES